ncbi:heme peroxidase [Rhodotorula toruloides]|uniref:Peroxidase n=1 Tax=Rhodotorula toruloides TaxID=5286 RepID=A0A0K3CBX9_RHOTO|nr:heme peroxidase [Rhodotorula toruloides]
MAFASVLRTATPRLAVRAAPQLARASARRAFASEASSAPKGNSGGSNNGLLFGLLGAGALGGGLYLYTRDSSDNRNVKDAASPQQVDYQKVYNAIADILEDEKYDDGSYGPVLVRLAWHASGTYDKETGNGGSNGATMRFAPEANHGANAGLEHARNRLEIVKKKFPEITYSDLWTLAGVCAIQEMGGPYITWRAGRKDGNVENCTPDGRLPDGDKGADHVRKIFYRMGFNDQEIVALSGAHALGRCHVDRSGFDGPWQYAPTTFSNEYFRLLEDEKWQERKWKGPPQFENKSDKSLMMLRTDMALMTDKGFRQYTDKYAKDENAFFSDFSKAFSKLIHLGVPTAQLSEPVPLKKIEDQAPASA